MTYFITGFARVMEILENNKFILRIREMSLNLEKSGNVLEKYCLHKNPLRIK